LTQIGAVLDATDPFTVSSQTARDCTTVPVTTANWVNPTNPAISLTMNLGDTVCFNWGDAGLHSVQSLTPANFVDFFQGYGSGNDTQALTRNTNCSSSNLNPCSQLTPTATPTFRYCHTFDSTHQFNVGTYTFQCGIHTTGMTASITVRASPSPSPVTGQTQASSSSSGASTLSSFLWW